MESVGHYVTIGLRILELAGVLVGLMFVVGLFLGLLRSIWKVTIGRQTLILPFQGSEKGAAVSRILSERLGSVEREWAALTEQVLGAQGPASPTDAPSFVDLGGLAPRSRPDRTLDAEKIELVLDEPMEGEALPPIRFGGVTVSPDALFAVSHRVRTALARRTIRGAIHEFASTVRVAASLRLPGRPTRSIVIVREMATTGQLIDLVDDLAFQIAKVHLDFETAALTWKGYRAFLDAYAHHLRFLKTAKVIDRDKAIGGYEASIAGEPGYELAHYNLATLLYNRYREPDNERSIEHFRYASMSEDDDLRALALAGLALAYRQRVHRFGYPVQPSASLADGASTKAVLINQNLEETGFARAFVHQILGRLQEAIEVYRKVVDLPGASPEELRIKSYALNNAGWVLMTKVGDLDQAQDLFQEALHRFPNKMTYANLGELHRRRGQYEDALHDYAKAIQLDPDYVNALNETAMVYVGMARSRESRDGQAGRSSLLEGARLWHARAVAVAGDQAPHERAQLHRTLAAAYQEAGFHSEARREHAEELRDARSPAIAAWAPARWLRRLFEERN